jgi:hypothetical protein
MTTRKSCQARQKRTDTGIVVTAHQLAQAKCIAMRQVTTIVIKTWRKEKYGHVPREKPAHLIRIVLENFNSLCISSGNAKNNSY